MQDAPYTDRCWEWPGKKHENGYGYLTFLGEQVLAHRFFFAVAHGPIPQDLLVRHDCDNPSCVNPAHLRLGTHFDNVRDRDTRGRTAIGSRHGRAKVDEQIVRDIRSRVAAGESRSAMAREFGISLSSASNIVDRKSWVHVA
jgi:hypothetical protein